MAPDTSNARTTPPRADGALPQSRSPGCLLFELLETERPRTHRVGPGGAIIALDGRVELNGGDPGGEHDRLHHAGDGWLLTRTASTELCVNGVRCAGDRALSAGDHITVARTRFIFYPIIDARPPQANGFDRARRHIELALEVPGDIDRSMVKMLADLERSIDGAERMAIVQPAIALMNKKSWQPALALLDRLATANPNHANIQLHRAICLAMLGRIHDGIAAAQRALQLANDAEMKSHVGDWLEQIPDLVVQAAIRMLNDGNHASAKAILVEFETKHPEHFGILFYLAICEIKDKRFAEASELRERARRGAKTDDERAAVTTLLGQLKEARLRAEAKPTIDKAVRYLNNSSVDMSTAALLELQSLPAEVLELEDVKLIVLAARARRFLAKPLERLVTAAARAQLSRELAALASSTDDSDIRDSARKILDSLA